MRNKETGEFELVVGDKQLLSGFFIGVLLLAVVFAMGYVLGQNSPHPPKGAETAALTATPSQDGRPQPAAPAATPPHMDPAVTQAQQAADGAPPAETRPEPSTQPAREASAPSRPAAAAPPPPLPPPAADPPAGAFWQVTASSSRTSAEAVYRTLKDQGFSSQVRPGPGSLTVVWVGPYNDKDSLAKAKKRLEDAGFSNLLKRP